MKQVRVRKAEPIVETLPVETTELIIGGESMPYEQCDLSLLRKQQADEAATLEQALHDSLSGGTYHQLLVKMLQRKTSLLIVPQGGLRLPGIGLLESALGEWRAETAVVPQGGNDDSGT